MNTRCYYENAELQRFPALFSGECIDRSERLKEQYGEQETHDVIYETVLTEPEATCDNDLSDMISLCERYQVKLLAILAFKPDSAYEWERFPSAAQMEEAARQIKAYRGPVEVGAESCFSQMRALLGRSALAGNLNRGIRRGCCAGRDQVSVSVDGKLTPCRHLDYREEYDSILEYWEKSPFLAELRKVEDKRREPCLGCRYENYCLPCNAVGYKLHGEFTYGLAACELGQAEREGR